MKKIFSLFLTFMKIGTFTFGGGYAMIAMLESELVEKKNWIEKDEFLDIVAIAESTPGPIAINSATYIGYKTSGVLGSVMSTAGVCLPSVVIIYLISLFFDKFLSLTLVGLAFRGIRVCVIYLILSAGIKMFKGLDKNVFNVIVFLLVMTVMIAFSLFSVNFSTVFYILLSGLAGIAVYLIRKVSKAENKEKKK